MIDSVVLPYHSDIDLSSACKELITLLEVGGEGRFPRTVSLNPSLIKTLEPNKGEPIPRHLRGRAGDVPLPSNSVCTVVMERTPLRRTAALEFFRVVTLDGLIILRHSASTIDPHRVAIDVFGLPVARFNMKIRSQTIVQSVFRSDPGRTMRILHFNVPKRILTPSGP